VLEEAKLEEAAEEDAEPVADEAAEPPAAAPARNAKDSIGLQKKNAGMPDAAQQAASPAERSLDKEEVWELIERGDAAAKSGRCHDASALYRTAEASAPNDLAKAAIQVGLGACTEADNGDASRFWSTARALDPGIDDRIQEMREGVGTSGKSRGKPQPQKRKKAKAKTEQNAYDAPLGE
jgi:hypothetical protein